MSAQALTFFSLARIYRREVSEGEFPAQGAQPIDRGLRSLRSLRHAPRPRLSKGCGSLLPFTVCPQLVDAREVSIERG